MGNTSKVDGSTPKPSHSNSFPSTSASRLQCLEIENKQIRTELAKYRHADRSYAPNQRLNYIADIEKQLKEAQEKLATRDDTLARLMQAKEALEKDATFKEPLFEVGKAVRIRFLAHAIETLDDRRIDKFKVYTLTGNAAAHAGCAEADVALFIGNFLSDDQKILFGDIVTKLYRTELNPFEARPKKLLEAIDCQVTIITAKMVKEKGDRSIKERLRAMEDIDIIISKYPRLQSNAFDSDTDILRRLNTVKEFTRLIVGNDRQFRTASRLSKNQHRSSKSED